MTKVLLSIGIITIGLMLIMIGCVLVMDKINYKKQLFVLDYLLFTVLLNLFAILTIVSAVGAWRGI